jgi:O-antigen ligase
MTVFNRSDSLLLPRSARKIAFGFLPVVIVLLVWFPLSSSAGMNPRMLHRWNLVHDALVAILLIAAIPLLIMIMRRKASPLHEAPLLYLCLAGLSLLPIVTIPTLGLSYVRMHIMTVATFGGVFLFTRWCSTDRLRSAFFLLLGAWGSWAIVSAIRGLGRIISPGDSLLVRIDVMGHSNSRAGYELLLLLLLLGIVMEASRKTRLLLLPFVLLLFVSIATSLSRGAWLGCIGGLVIIVAATWNWWRALVLAIIGGGGLFVLPGVLGARARTMLDMQFPTNVFRINLWREVGAIILESPFGGCGYDTLWFAASTRLGPTTPALEGKHAHNLVLQTWSEIGLLGLLALGVVFFTMIRMARGLQKSTHKDLRGIGLGILALLTGVLAHGLVDFTWRDYQQQILFWSLAGWLAAADSTGTQGVASENTQEEQRH